ncbi:P-loop containing nucleoside triphosphate hydrolase protein [Truncatella angustata]|uniref:P-loop containing nucleoside triphosphate hydrolase protein n=1 Tax=Truncatella angustata TaxID=152316 RepID=A0A9P8RJV7_9PEZI|nr:P-loop containing nucleoside triphosphate hydrolase protein [Truncatella angustata]KAH6647202.1 P-loop containing nucleoside triphosphate hydrolase protein [Truncatella angustata]
MDFALFFQQTVLSILPSTIFICASILRILSVIRGPLRVNSAWLLSTQIVLLTSLIRSNAVNGSVAVAASVLRLVVSVVVLCLLYQEHQRWNHPSILTSSYLVFTILLELVEARILGSRLGYTHIATMFAVSIAAKFVILLLQELPKASSSIFNQLGTAKKPTSSLLKQTLLWWPNLLFNKGHRNILTNSDLGDVDEEFDSRTLLAAITSTWANSHKVGKYSLVWVVLKTLKLQCLAIAVPRLLLSAFMFAQPFLINRVIDFVGEPPTRYDLEVTRGLIAETFFVYAGIAVTRCYSKHLRFQLITMIRGALVGIIYQKTLNLETSSISESAPVTLMSTDIDGIISATQSFHDLWPSVIEVGVGLFLLDRKAGHSSFLVLVPGIFCWLISQAISKTAIPAQRAWNEAIQARVSVTSSMLGQIKGIKMVGLSDYMTQTIHSFRVFELDMSRKLRTVLAWVTSLSSDIFTTLSMVMLVAQPISTIVGSYTVFISGLACCSRIQSFLLLNEKAEYRLSALYRFAGRNQSPVVDVRQATFTTKDQQIKLLREIEFQISTGSISMIVGRVGCGKSSLLKGILGELHMTSGTVHLATSSISYCDQTPWLRNISIRDNITGPLRFEKDWYAQVVSACALDRDFTSFPCGDQTLVGSGGISLSGGQRQRVGLARAVYSRSALVLLDDVFSGLDDTTSAAVFSALLGDGGLLRNRNITVLFATHSIQFLNNADFVTVLELGMIKYNQVKFDSINNELKNAIRRNVMKTRIDIRPNVNSEDELSKLPCHKASSGSPKDPDLTRQAGDLGLYMFYVGSIGPVFALILIVLAVSFSVFKKMPQIWIRIWTQHGIDEDKGHFIGIYLTFVVACFASIWLLSRFFLIHVISRSSQHLHSLLLNAVMKAPLHFFTLTDNGSTLNRFSQDMTIIDQVLPGSSFNALRDTFNIITEIIIITSGARYVAAIIPFCTVALYFVQSLYLRTSRQIRRLDLEAKSPLYTHFSETLTGLVTIRAMGWKQDFIEENSNRLNKSQRPFYLVYSVQVWLNIVLDFVVCGIATALVAVAVLTRDSTSKAAIGLALLNIISFNNTLSFLINSWTNLETSLGAVARLRTFLLQIPEEGFIAERQDPPADWPTMGDIRFNNVTSSYGPELAPTIRSVSLNIKAGQKVGICGRTGSGKSSLILTLLRLLDLRSGSLHIDGLDLSILRREAIRSRIITLPQEPVILPGTVRENLCPANQVFSDKDLVAALEKTGIWEVISFRGGLMAELDEIGLSVGQKQLFCLSRAVLHEAKILLLDEATSNLDPDTEQKLRRVIRTELADCTILEVAHKLEAIASYDLVIIMQDGEIVEMGDPRELLQVDLSGSV